MAIGDALLLQYADPTLTQKPPELSERGGAYYSEAGRGTDGRPRRRT